MSDLLAKGAAWLSGQLKDHASQSVTYERGVDTVAVQATVGRTVFELENEEGDLERWESRDFLIDTADLVLAGSPTLPDAGDRIRETVGTTTYVYEVMSPGNEPHWRYVDPHRNKLRIHTKLIDTL